LITPRIHRQNIPPPLLEHLLDASEHATFPLISLAALPSGWTLRLKCLSEGGSNGFQEWSSAAKAI
jgi:hypothetical protein